jgi:hypothetical protein
MNTQAIWNALTEVGLQKTDDMTQFFAVDMLYKYYAENS